MKRRDVLAGHTERIGRRDLGARHHGGFHAYATTVGCECGWTGPQLPMAPSCGGRIQATKLHQGHVENLLARDPVLTVLHARTAWRDWYPGDGVCYRVKVCRIEGGLADCDKILLVNVGERTWAFQFAVTPERRARLRSNAPFLTPLSKGVPTSVWSAVQPLLAALDAI